MSPRVLSLSQLYPGREHGRQGVFIQQRLEALPERFAVEVWRTRPHFPGRGGVSPPARELVGGIPVQDVPFFYLPRLGKSLDGAWLHRALRKRSTEQVDLLDAHFAFPTGWAAMKLASERSLPLVVTLRGTELPYSRESGRRRRIGECLKGATRIIAVSRSLAKLALSLGAREEHVRVVENGIDPRLFHGGEEAALRRELLGGRRGPLLLTVGGLTERKGVARVLAVLPALVQRYPSLLYLVLGGGGVEGDEEHHIRKLVRHLGLGAQVRLLGEKPLSRLPPYYRAADLFVLATRNEGWANVLMEALASGCRVVTTDVGGNREVLREGALGSLVPFGDAQALQEALLEALAAWERGPAPTCPRLKSWKEVGEAVAAVFEEALGEGGR